MIFSLRFITLLVVLGFSQSSTSAPASTNGAWEIVKIEGLEYVSMDSIKRFYTFDSMTRSGDTIVLTKGNPNDKNKMLSVNFRVGSNECLMNNVKFIFSHNIAPIAEKAYVSRVDLGKLIDPVLRPNIIANAGNFKTIILDPGHGGRDPGAINSLGCEAVYNLRVANRVKTQLQASGFKVMMTRTDDVYQSLQERVDFANSVKENAIYISIHFNSGSSSAHGIETFTLSPPGTSHYGHDLKSSDSQPSAGNEHDSANIALATAVHGWTLFKLGSKTCDRGIKRARFSVLSGVCHPAILLEGGFMSHPEEARMIHKEDYQQALADGIVYAVKRYRLNVGGSQAPATPK
jgi:N-acetylmuramoyl-L-alanine amidase